MPFLASPRYRRRPLRLLRLTRIRLSCRLRHLFLVPLVRGYTWAYFGASALIGFEGIEIVFGVFILAPEVIPFVLLLLGLTWAAKSRAVRTYRLLRLRLHRRRAAARRRRIELHA